MYVISLFQTTNHHLYLDLFHFFDYKALHDLYCWLEQGVFWPPMMLDELFVGLRAFYNNVCVEGYHISKNSLSDTTIIFWHEALNKPQNYFIDSYTEKIVLKEKLFKDKAIWSHNNFGIHWQQNNNEKYISNNWNRLGSWKETDKICNLGVYSFHLNYFPEWVSEFHNKYIKMKFDVSVFYRKHSRSEVYNIIYTNPRSLMHHDYVVGQYITTNLFWNNEEVSNVRQQYNGLSVLWYERFGAIDAIVKNLWSFFYMTEYIEFVDKIDVYTTIWRKYDSFNYFVIEPRWIWYNSLYELEDIGWATRGFWNGGPCLFISQEPDEVFSGAKKYEWINVIYYAMHQDDIE